MFVRTFFTSFDLLHKKKLRIFLIVREGGTMKCPLQPPKVVRKRNLTDAIKCS